MLWSLKSRKVLVTGGSRGIGAECVTRFAAEGADVAINYLRSSNAATKLAEHTRDQYGVKTCIVPGDMGKPSDNRAVVRKTLEELGGLDIIVSNAGNSKIAPFGDLFALSEEDWDHTYDVLVKANIFLLQEALPIFESNPDGGCFLIMSSLAGLVTNGSSLAYSVCRAAVNHLARCLAQTQGPKVRVNSVCPGLVDTERTQQLSLDSREGFKEAAVLKRVTTKAEVADTFVYLAKNTALTGEVIRVDSGMAIR